MVTDGVKLSANPFDDIALEEALRLREKGVAEEVVVVGIGPADLTAHLRNGLAMGANRAIHVVTTDAVQPLTAARIFQKLIEKEQPGLVILGKQAIDDDANQTGQMLAALWERPQATFASKVEIADGKATVTRESTCRPKRTNSRRQGLSAKPESNPSYTSFSPSPCPRRDCSTTSGASATPLRSSPAE